jgi:hypothetical protein
VALTAGLFPATTGDQTADMPSGRGQYGVPVGVRGKAERSAERAAELTGVGEPPPGGQQVDRHRGPCGVGQVSTAPLQPTVADPFGGRLLLFVERPVQGAQ